MARVVEPRDPPSVVERKDGRRLRRATLYFPPALYRRLKVFCAENSLDASDVATAALEDFLEGLPAKLP